MERRFYSRALAAALLAVAGCFNEPEPAYKSVVEGQRVYLKEKGYKSFSEVPRAALKLGEKIDYLNLDRNALTNVDGVASLTGLKWLRLNGNALKALPDLKGLVNLRRIYLRDNRFATVPEALKELPNLTDIDLSGNPIREVPEWLARKEGLENLSFTGTQITKLPEDLSAWKSLKSLQLGDLRLSAEEMKRIRAAFEPGERPLGTAVVF